MNGYVENRSNVNLLEQFYRRSYVLNKNDKVSYDMFRVLYNGTQSYYTFSPGCRTYRTVRRMLSVCYTIEIDSTPVAVIHNDEFRRTGNITATIIENPLDPYPNATIYLASQINMRRFMFQIFAIEQTKQRLIAQVNAVPPGSSKLPAPDAYAFTVDITEEINDKEFELTLILCLTIDDMRDYMINDDDDKEDFYDSD